MFLFGIFATPLPYVIFFFIYLYGCAFVFPIDIPADTNRLPAIAEVNTLAEHDNINNQSPSPPSIDALLNTGVGFSFLKTHSFRICVINIGFAHPKKYAGSYLPRPPPLGTTTSLFI